MYRRPNRADTYPSSNPNSSTTSHSPTAAAAASPSGTMSDDDDVLPTPFSNHRSPPPSPSPSPSPSHTTNNEILALPAPPPVKSELLALPPPALTPSSSSARTPAFPAREDCWSEPATHTLIEAWGSHYMELNRGNLRQKHWQEVADTVNSLHGHAKRQYRTDIQCKNRIDTLKKKYKIEKSRVSQSHGRYVSTWPFFNYLDSLIGDNFKPSPSPAPASVGSKRKSPPVLPPPPSAVPVGPRSKRPVAVLEEMISRRNFSTMAAAAAAAAEESDDEETETSSPEAAGVAMFAAPAAARKTRSETGALAEGYKRLAEAVGRFGDIYARVEEAKQRQMVELEKQRMQFAKDLEIQRMKLLMESQVQLEKLKRSKRSSQADGYL